MGAVSGLPHVHGATAVVWILLSSCTGQAKPETGEPPTEPILPDCGDYSVNPPESWMGVDWVGDGFDLYLMGVPGMYFGMAGPLVPGGDLYLAESCQLGEPYWPEFPEERGCRSMSTSGIYLETADDPTSFDFETETAFSEDVADEMTYVIVFSSDQTCWTFGHDTCIYLDMGCAQIFGYSGE